MEIKLDQIADSRVQGVTPDLVVCALGIPAECCTCTVHSQNNPDSEHPQAYWDLWLDPELRICQGGYITILEKSTCARLEHSFGLARRRKATLLNSTVSW